MKLQDYISKYGNIEVEEKQLNELLGIKESKIWKPKKGATYYVILSNGEITNTIWDGDKNLFDYNNWLMGNVYQTKEEAELVLEKHKIEIELQRFALEHNEHEINWNDPFQNKYYIYYSHINKKIQIAADYTTGCGQVHFTSRKIAEQAIQAIGEERLKKYYFRDEEI